MKKYTKILFAIVFIGIIIFAGIGLLYINGKLAGPFGICPRGHSLAMELRGGNPKSVCLKNGGWSSH